MEESPNGGVNDTPRQPEEAAKESTDTSTQKTAGCSGGCCGRCEQIRDNLRSTNWHAHIPGGGADYEIVEVHFKNTRKGFYRLPEGMKVQEGDMVAVEAQPGHDIGRVALTGDLVKIQMKRAGFRSENYDAIKSIFRKAKPQDLEKYEEAKARENDTMIRSRRIAESLGLNMKIGDVEYQGDGNKAIFYYIAD